jgi:uncharacterized protein (TIGR03546 family)
MTPFGPIKAIILALQGGSDPKHVAAGFALGAMLGLVPKGNLFAVIFVLLFFLVRVDKNMAIFAAFVFTPLGYVLDGLAHMIGGALLTAGFLRPLWTFLYDLPIVPLTRFNNSVVLGNVAIGLLLFVPLYLGFIKVVLAYRSRYKERVDRWPIVKFLKGLGFYQTYQRWLGQ